MLVRNQNLTYLHAWCSRWNEAELLEHHYDPHVKVTPDMEYKFVAKVVENQTERPVVIGFGPCGLFAGLVLAQMGFNPIIAERGKEALWTYERCLGFSVSVHWTPNQTLRLVKAAQVHSLTVSFTAKLKIQSTTAVK